MDGYVLEKLGPKRMTEHKAKHSNSLLSGKPQDTTFITYDLSSLCYCAAASKFKALEETN